MSAATETAKPARLALRLSGELSDTELENVAGGLALRGPAFDADEPGLEALAVDPPAPAGDVTETATAAGEVVVALAGAGSGAASSDALASRMTGIAASISVESKDEPDDGSYEASMDAVARQAPEFQNTGRTEVLLGTTTENGTTRSVAGITLGASEISDAGNGVTMTTKYTVAAIAQAYVSQTSAGAGAMVGTGVSASFDLGRGVTFEASAETVAKAGVGAGIVGNNLVVEGGVSAAASATAEISAVSEALDDTGTTARGDTSVSAGAQAVASGEGSIGANGISGDYGANAGLYVKADGEASLGNAAAGMTIGGGAITPGSVSAGISGGATIDDGKLTLSFGSEFAFLLGGVSVSFSLDLQLLDGTDTVGTAEEISAVEQEALDRARVYDQSLTEEWRRTLTEDAVAAGREVAESAGRVSEALVAIERYDDGVKTAAASFAETQAKIDLVRETLANETDPARRAEVLAMLDRDEADLKTRVTLWEEKMSSPEEAARRETMFGDFRAAQGKLDVLQGFADGVNERLKVANSMTYMQFQTILEATAKVVQERLDTARQGLEIEKVAAADVAEEMRREQQTIVEDRSRVAEMTKGETDGVNRALIERDIDQRQAKYDDRAEMVARTTDERVSKAAADVVQAQQQLTAANEYAEKHQPLASAALSREYTITLAGDLQKRYESLPEAASDAERRALLGALEGAKLAQTLASDNADRINGFVIQNGQTMTLLEKELERLKVEVRVPGLLSEIGRLFD